MWQKICNVHDWRSNNIDEDFVNDAANSAFFEGFRLANKLATAKKRNPKAEIYETYCDEDDGCNLFFVGTVDSILKKINKLESVNGEPLIS